MTKIKIGDTIAAIDLGSNYLRMSIAEISTDKSIKLLEEVIKPTNIGKDTFTSRKISIQTMHETCNYLKGFSQLLKDYKVKFYKAVSTSGIREAENKQYILEQIRLRTGLNVECINTAEERLFMLKAIDYNSNLDSLDRALIVNITSGVVEVSIYEKGQLKFTEEAKIGSLRLRETLGELESKTTDFPSIMEQFIENKIYSIKSTIESLDIKYLIGLGGELKTIFTIINTKSSMKNQKCSMEKESFIKREDFIELYKHIQNMTNDQIRFAYGISYKTAELLLPSILIFYCFLKITKSKNIQIPMASLREGILYDLSEKLIDIDKRKESIKHIISSVWYIGEKYGIDKKHAAFVENIALSIFDQTKKLHKLEEKERLYLQIASILHDVGIFIDASNHCIQSYNIIQSQNIIGFSNRDLHLTANIARYHSEEIPNQSHKNYYVLCDQDRMKVSILSAILRLAEALDISHLQKIEELNLSEDRDLLYFNLSAKDDIILEEWNFINNSNFFEEVFGVKLLI
ncbi:exopolyphosphatase [Clostridium thailandense]|uniref:Ppx/GppA phosphatase family protein n=1 Tax=Clostridium thailandense TaxID=2794346 RepID=UPI0039894626